MLNFRSYLNKLTRNNRIYYKLIYSRKNSNQSKKLKPKLNEKISNEPFFKNLCISRMISDDLPQNALRSNLDVKVDLDIAIKQHNLLQEALISAGLDLIELPSDGCPDSVFVEDTSVVVGKKVLINNMGASARKGESRAIENYLGSLEEIELVKMTVGCLDGGDVLFTGKEFFIGLSKRTNNEGIKFLQTTFPNYPVHTIDIRKHPTALHLKSASSMLWENHIAVGGEIGNYIAEEISRLSQEKYVFSRLSDPLAANCIFVNNVLIRRHVSEFPRCVEGFRALDQTVKNMGGTVIEVDASELSKVDGALSCCCILLNI